MKTNFSPRTDLLLCLLLAAATLAVYGPLHSAAFILYDDPVYVTANVNVQRGLTLDNLLWALTTPTAANWHPLTWLSHMTDWELFGDWAGGHHLMSVSLHALTSVLLYLLMVRLTGWRWPSFLVAGLFALHPLHVESVAWVAERKDVLSALMMVLTLWAYVRYTEQRTLKRYAAVFVLLALGLMAKPMLVTLPFVLLLLDYWPLGRWRGSVPALAPHAPPPQLTIRQLIIEKLPLVALAAASAIVTIFVQRAGGAVASMTENSPAYRLANAVVAYGAYLLKTFWPVDLVYFYAGTGTVPTWQIVLSAAALVAITVLVLKARRSRPYLLVGWLWYLGTLVPVIGLVQVGSQTMADRYTYVPLIGIFIMIAGLAADLANSRRDRTAMALVPVVGLAALLVCAALAYVQAGYWQSTFTLAGHAIAVDRDNLVAHQDLGGAFRDQAAELKAKGQATGDAALLEKSKSAQQRAKAEFREALRINPNYPEANANLAEILSDEGDTGAAAAHYEAALKSRPNFAEVQYNYGTLLMGLGQYEAARQRYARALESRPGHVKARFNLAVVLMALKQVDAALAELREVIRQQPDLPQAHGLMASLLDGRGDLAGAEAQYREALRLNPDYTLVRYSYAALLERTGRPGDAAAAYRQVLRLQPNNFAALSSLAWILATSGDARLRNGREAIDLASRAWEVAGHNYARAADSLAAGLAETGQFARAAQMAGLALDLAQRGNDPKYVEAVRARQELYRSGRPYHEP